MRPYQFTIRNLFLLATLIAGTLGAYRCLTLRAIGLLTPERMGVVTRQTEIAQGLQVVIAILLGLPMLAGFIMGSSFWLKLRGAMIALAIAFVTLYFILLRAA